MGLQGSGTITTKGSSLHCCVRISFLAGGFDGLLLRLQGGRVVKKGAGKCFLEARHGRRREGVTMK